MHLRIPINMIFLNLYFFYIIETKNIFYLSKQVRGPPAFNKKSVGVPGGRLFYRAEKLFIGRLKGFTDR